MTKVKVAVVEDEKIFADILCHTLNNLGYEPLSPDVSYEEAIETIENQDPDIVIIDIRLKSKKDGIDLAQKINEKYQIPFVFLTSNSDKLTIDRAKKVNPPAYLIKPFNEKELFTSIEIALYSFAKKQSTSKNEFILNKACFIKQNNIFIKIEFDNILFLKSDHIYIEFFTIGGQKYLIRGSLKDYLKKLSKKFIRIHRGYIINISHIQTIDHGYVTINGERIPIGKSYRKALLNKINLG